MIEKIKQLQEELNVASSIVSDIKKEVKGLGYYVDENNVIQQVEKVYAYDIDYTFNRKYVGEVGWLQRWGSGLVELPLEAIKLIAKDKDSLEGWEMIDEALARVSWYLDDLPIEDIHISGNVEDGTFRVDIDVYGIDEHDEYSYADLDLCIRQVDKRECGYEEEDNAD